MIIGGKSKSQDKVDSVRLFLYRMDAFLWDPIRCVLPDVAVLAGDGSRMMMIIIVNAILASINNNLVV